jgi:hypothetical protein
MTVTFTLTAGSSATAAGPFNISGTTSGGALNDVSIATGVTKAQLLTGHSISNISETITGGTIASTGTTCPSSTTRWYVIAATPTPTPTATPSPCGCLTVYNESGDRSIIFQYVRCSDGNLTSTSVASGANKTVCVQSGTDITSDDIGLLTVVDCGTSCTINDDCTPCS